MDTLADTAALEARILREIPLARAMQLAVSRYSGDALELEAPLAPNRNDKGCAFGGSLTALMTLAAWGLVELDLRGRGLACDIFVGDSQVRYQEPVWGALHAVARVASPDALPALAAALHERGKGHIDMRCEIRAGEATAATLAARFFARLRK
ncbi:MAG TPA: YiiD C-terminal domain-containing protein [Rhodanobacteraceae bacterium]|nr:YiiD C-terminal domain-containing protein [Rhodanobacteraceae bacterium]